MDRCIIRVFLATIILVSLLFTSMTGMVLAAHEEQMEGFVVKHGKDFVIEADDGDYIVRGKYLSKGKDLSQFIGKMVLVTGDVTENQKGDTIDIKSIELMENVPPD